jgi:hypothetical protein
MLRRYRPKKQPKPIKPWAGVKPQLPMQVTHLCRIHYIDLQAYLAAVYKMKGYNILFAVGITHGMLPEYIVTGALPSATNIKQQSDNIRRGRPTRNLHLILNVLCADGFIGKGKYIIDTTPRNDDPCLMKLKS